MRLILLGMVALNCATTLPDARIQTAIPFANASDNSAALAKETLAPLWAFIYFIVR
jgi:hypothetical protein